MQLRRALHRAAAGGQLVRIASSSGTLVGVTIDTRTVTGGRSLRLPMTWEEWQALGETKHHEWWDGVCVVNPPNLWHTRVARRLLRLLDDHRPPGHEALAERGLRTPLGDFEPDVVLVPLEGPAGSYVFDPPFWSSRSVRRPREAMTGGTSGSVTAGRVCPGIGSSSRMPSP